MSLKSFHIFFIIVSIILMIVVGVWGIRSYRAIGDVVNLTVGIVGLVSAVVLFAYLKAVLKKYKDKSLLAFLFVFILTAHDVWACSVCYGDPNSKMAAGLRMAVLVLLIVILVVLSLFGALILHFKKRAKQLAQHEPQNI